MAVPANLTSEGAPPALPLSADSQPAAKDWTPWVIILGAFALRILHLGIKPAHFDEGVNGWFVDQMTRQGFYHYDPTNFHGPLHFYILFVAQTLLGRHTWALRLPLVVVSTACVAMMMAFRPYLGKATCRWAALAMAISPGYIFYGRYAIHESYQVLFLLVTAWGILGLFHFGSRWHLYSTLAGLSGLVLTKETYVIHVAALVLACVAVYLLEHYSPPAPVPRAVARWTGREALAGGGLAVGAILLFYSGFLLDISGLAGLGSSISSWVHTGVHGETGHEKSPAYWLELMARYEWPALVGLAATAASMLPGTTRSMRWLAISATGTLFAYSIVAYKTPWCIISIIWPFYFVFGAAICWGMKRLDRWVTSVTAGVLLACSLSSSVALNFRNFTKEDEPYVYVQTLPDIERLLGPLRALVALDARSYHMPGYVVLSDAHPLNWLLGDFTHVSFINLTELPADVSDGEFFLVAEEYATEVERVLQGRYFREKITMRGNSGAVQMLYFRDATFAPLLPGRTPEFTGPAAASVNRASEEPPEPK